MESTSEETRAELRRRNGERVMLAFSRGKDAIGAWLALRADGFEVVPVHYETIPGLSFVRESISYYERFFGTSIINVPHPSFFSAVDRCLYQPAWRADVLNEMEMHRRINYRDVFDAVAAQRQCGGWYATGVRASDSLTRRISLKTHGALIESEQKAHVVWDWSAEHLRDELRKAGVRLPVDYKLFGRSFDGLGIEYLAPMKQAFPADYARCLEYFPMLDIEVFRDEKMRRPA